MYLKYFNIFFFFSSRRRHTRYIGDWSSDVCSSDLELPEASAPTRGPVPAAERQWAPSSPSIHESESSSSSGERASTVHTSVDRWRHGPRVPSPLEAVTARPSAPAADGYGPRHAYTD